MIAIVTGSGGLVGSEMCRFLINKGWNVIGIDNNSREKFFGEAGSTANVVMSLRERWAYVHQYMDIRNYSGMKQYIFEPHKEKIKLVVHTAAQPAHDWAAANPSDDFDINVKGTHNMLELTRQFCPEAPFIFTSSSKVYNPNKLEMVESDLRYWPKDLPNGIPESFPIEQNGSHSLFGAHKAAADVIAQEYADYFGLKVGIFRCGCLTGPTHSGVELHGFLNYLVRCVKYGHEYTIYGYKGKQVRDNIHSEDLISAFYEFYKDPKPGVYNLGGGLHANCSIHEAINIAYEHVREKGLWLPCYEEKPRHADHIWYVSDTRKFQQAYPFWRPQWGIEATIKDIYEKV